MIFLILVMFIFYLSIFGYILYNNDTKLGLFVILFLTIITFFELIYILYNMYFNNKTLCQVSQNMMCDKL